MGSWISLIRHEGYKIARNRLMWLLGAALTGVYLFTTHIYYQWNPGTAWERITLYPYSSGTIFEGLLILIVLSTSFTQEYQLKTDSLILSSPRGRRQLVWAKMAAASIYISILVLFYWGLNLLINLVMAGPAGWEAPIQLLSRYGTSPYSMSIWQYTLVQMLTNWLGSLAFGLCILYLSALCRSYLVVFFWGGLVLVIPFFIHNFSGFSVPWLLKNLPMTEIMRVENVFARERYLLVGEFHIPLPLPVFYVYTLGLTAMLAWGAYRRFSRWEGE